MVYTNEPFSKMEEKLGLENVCNQKAVVRPPEILLKNMKNGCSKKMQLAFQASTVRDMESLCPEFLALTSGSG